MNVTDAAKTAAIAVVLINDRFLTSHAYLKDSTVCVRTCHLAAAGKDPRGPVINALKQANLEADDIQLVEMQGPISSSAQGVKILGDVDFSEDDTPSARELSPLAGFGATNLAGLCGIGEYRL